MEKFAAQGYDGTKTSSVSVGVFVDGHVPVRLLPNRPESVFADKIGA